MAIYQRTLTEEHVRQIFDLACTPFLLKAFRDRWNSFGWSYYPDTPNDLRVEVKTVDDWPFLVDQLDDKVHCAIMPVCLWTTYSQQSHSDQAECQRERKAFDKAFEAAQVLSQHVLSAPFLHWTDDGANAYRASAWEGTHGILILQQAARDLIDGVEINFWLEACSRREFRPTGSMLGWLERRSLELHDKHGYGPPVWD